MVQYNGKWPDHKFDKAFAKSFTSKKFKGNFESKDLKRISEQLNGPSSQAIGRCEAREGPSAAPANAFERRERNYPQRQPIKVF